MKLLLNLKWIFLLLIFINCKEQKPKQTIPIPTITSDKITSEIGDKDELYVGKKFYSGDELNNYTFILSKDIKKNDSLTYSIYKKNDGQSYLFSIEKLVSNDDRELFKIIDLFRFNDYNSANNKVRISDQKNGYSVSFLEKDKILKKWEFQSKNDKTSNSWNGKYECNFLRIKEESADPRAFGMININIENSTATFQLDSYNEVIDKNLMILESGQNKIILCDADNKNSKYSIVKNNGEYTLTSDLLNKTTGETTSYTLKKIK